MIKMSKEEYTQSDQSSKVSAQSKHDIYDIDKILNQMQATFKANLEAQESYIDILKRKNKNINSNYIKVIYALFTENKANQICFQKEAELLGTVQWDEKLLRRYYARIIEMGIRKISYFWMNSGSLDFLSTWIVKLMREVYSCFNDMNKLKNLDTHLTILKLLFSESSMLQQRIYELLINEGYLMSMDEFYRINGVDLVGDQSYEGKNYKTEAPSQRQSEQQIGFKKQLSKSKPAKTRVRQSKRVWNHSKKSSSESLSVTPSPIIVERNKAKIKDMMEQIMDAIKSSEEQSKTKPLQVIAQQYVEPKIQENKIQSTKELPVKPQRTEKTKRRVSKPQNFFLSQFKKRTNEKKMTIELMSYFSNQFKTAISEAPQVDIDYLSQLLMSSQSHSNSKPIPVTVVGKQSNEASIHSIRSLQSIKRIKEQKKRGKLMQIALRKQYSEFYSQLYESTSEQDQYSKASNQTPSIKINKQKFSFKSAPGVYINLPKKRTSKQKNKVLNLKERVSTLFKNRFVFRQSFEKEQIFENQLIMNQLISKQVYGSLEKINFTNVNGDDLRIGIGNRELFQIKSCPSEEVNSFMNTPPYYERSMNANELKRLRDLKSKFANNRISSQYMDWREYRDQKIGTKKSSSFKPTLQDSNFRVKLKKNRKKFSNMGDLSALQRSERHEGREDKENEEYEIFKSRISSIQSEEMNFFKRNCPNYTVYDRIRRVVIMER